MILSTRFDYNIIDQQAMKHKFHENIPNNKPQFILNASLIQLTTFSAHINGFC